MSIVTYPERVQTYLDQPNTKRLPFSCTLCVLSVYSQVSELMRFAIQSLKAGAGVKLVIDPTFILPRPRELDLVFVLDSEHPDWEYLDNWNIMPVLPGTSTGYHILKVKDSIESISDSFIKIENAVNSGVTKIQVDLSELRPRDSINSDGLTASGPVLFMEIYLALAGYLTKPSIHTLLRLFGTLNEIILRGGYKKGIITSAIHCNSQYLEEYLQVPLVSLRGSHKKGLILTDEFVTGGMGQLSEVIFSKVNQESMFLQKEHPDKTLYANVCQGIYLGDRGTCLIVRINLGLVTELGQLVEAFTEATTKAITLMSQWRKESIQNVHQWAKLEDDRQVAVDVMGLANLLGNMGISYQDFIKEMANPDTTDPLVTTLRKAYQESTKVADELCDSLGLPRLDRIHSVEPAQSHSYRKVDTQGYTVCRGIWPPFTRIVNRMSNTETIRTYDHGPNVEPHIHPDSHFNLCNEWQSMMDTYGKPHAISYDTWVDFDQQVFSQWYHSNLTTLYYNLSSTYDDDYTRKSIVPVSLVSEADCSVCAA